MTSTANSDQLGNDDCRWGVAGQRGVIYVEDFAGRMGVMTQIEDLEAVAASLDRRGVRELALSIAIDKTYKYGCLCCSRVCQLSSAGDRTYMYTWSVISVDKQCTAIVVMIKLEQSKYTCVQAIVGHKLGVYA